MCEIEDITEQLAALALQGPTSGALLKSVVRCGHRGLEVLPQDQSGKIGGVPVDISRTGYTGDLGYEIWIRWERRGQGMGRAHERRPPL